jgi:hypothetical protein
MSPSHRVSQAKASTICISDITICIVSAVFDAPAALHIDLWIPNSGRFVKEKLECRRDHLVPAPTMRCKNKFVGP